MFQLIYIYICIYLKFGDGDGPVELSKKKEMLVPHFIKNILRSGLTLISSWDCLIHKYIFVRYSWQGDWTKLVDPWVNIARLNIFFPYCVFLKNSKYLFQRVLKFHGQRWALQCPHHGNQKTISNVFFDLEF